MYSILRDCCFLFLCCVCVSMGGLYYLVYRVRDAITGRRVEILIPRFVAFAMYCMHRVGCAAMECALTRLALSWLCTPHVV